MLAALMRKELLALLRDAHGLAALFLMPAVFIVLMSLALKNAYEPTTHQLAYAIDARDAGLGALALQDAWESLNGKPQALPPDERSQRDALATGRLHYLLVIEPGWSEELRRRALPRATQLRLVVEPGLDANRFHALQAQLHAVAAELKLRALLKAEAGDDDGSSLRRLVQAERLAATGTRLTSVQHSVPAWLVFGMFFIVASLASLVVQERAWGVLARLRGLGVPGSTLLASKALPYVGVNAAQAVLMLAVGIGLMPALGGEGLSLRGVNLGALLLVLAAISAAAVSLALLLACLVRTHAQALAVGPISIVLMATVGGIMVPSFVMPAAMQRAAAWSPMNWGLEALLTVLVRGGGVAEVAPQLARMGVFAGLALALALLLFHRRP